MIIKDENLNRILPEIEKRIRELFGEKVLNIILFGSYARGDYHKESDVDLFVLVSDSDLRKYRKARVKIITEFLESYDILLLIRIIYDATFNRYKNVLPFYQNVINQGMNLYG